MPDVGFKETQLPRNFLVSLSLHTPSSTSPLLFSVRSCSEINGRSSSARPRVTPPPDFHDSRLLLPRAFFPHLYHHVLSPVVQRARFVVAKGSLSTSLELVGPLGRMLRRRSRFRSASPRSPPARQHPQRPRPERLARELMQTAMGHPRRGRLRYQHATLDATSCDRDRSRPDIIQMNDVRRRMRMGRGAALDAPGDHPEPTRSYP